MLTTVIRRDVTRKDEQSNHTEAESQYWWQQEKRKCSKTDNLNQGSLV